MNVCQCRVGGARRGGRFGLARALLAGRLAHFVGNTKREERAAREDTADTAVAHKMGVGSVDPTYGSPHVAESGVNH